MGQEQRVEVDQLTEVVAALGITIKAQCLPHEPLPDEFSGGKRREWHASRGWIEIGPSAWLVTLTHKGRTMESKFYQGSAHAKVGPHGTVMPTPPTAADVLSCLASDAGACEMPFEEWAADYGYDTDSRKAEATYRACQESGFKVKRLLGDDFERVRQAEH